MRDLSKKIVKQFIVSLNSKDAKKRITEAVEGQGGMLTRVFDSMKLESLSNDLYDELMKVVSEDILYAQDELESESQDVIPPVLEKYLRSITEKFAYILLTPNKRDLNDTVKEVIGQKNYNALKSKFDDLPAQFIKAAIVWAMQEFTASHARQLGIKITTMGAKDPNAFQNKNMQLFSTNVARKILKFAEQMNFYYLKKMDPTYLNLTALQNELAGTKSIITKIKVDLGVKVKKAHFFYTKTKQDLQIDRLIKAIDNYSEQINQLEKTVNNQLHHLDELYTQEVAPTDELQKAWNIEVSEIRKKLSLLQMAFILESLNNSITDLEKLKAGIDTGKALSKIEEDKITDIGFAIAELQLVKSDIDDKIIAINEDRLAEDIQDCKNSQITKLTSVIQTNILSKPSLAELHGIYENFLNILINIVTIGQRGYTPPAIKAVESVVEHIAQQNKLQ